MDSSSERLLKFAQVRSLVENSEPHFVYLYLNTYQQALYYSWLKDPNNCVLLEKYEKRRQALDEQLQHFYPSNLEDEQCQAIRTVARMCAARVVRELRVIIKEQAHYSHVITNFFSVAIDDTFRERLQINPIKNQWEAKLSTLVTQWCRLTTRDY